MECKKSFLELWHDEFVKDIRKQYTDFQTILANISTASVGAGAAIGATAVGAEGAIKRVMSRIVGTVNVVISYALSDGSTPAQIGIVAGQAFEAWAEAALEGVIEASREAVAFARNALTVAKEALVTARTVAAEALAEVTGASAAASEATATRIAAETAVREAAAIAVTAEERAAVQLLVEAAGRAALIEAAKAAALSAAERAVAAAALEVTAAIAAEGVAAAEVTAATAGVAATIAGAPEIITGIVAFVGITLIAKLVEISAESAAIAKEEYDAQAENPNILDLVTDKGLTEGVELTHLGTFLVEDHNRRSGIHVELKGLTSETPYVFDEHCPDVLKLTDRADRLNVANVDLSEYDSWRFLDDEFTIDMSNRAGGNQSSDDFDAVTYAPRFGLLFGTNGVFWYNGETHSAGPISGGLTELLSTLAGPLGAPALKLALATEGLLPDDDLIVKGIENVILTEADDRFYFTGSDFGIHSGYGKIEGKGGGDIIVFDNAKFEGGDKQLELDGGEGKDWVYASGGTQAVTIGGLGRDWIYNTSTGGIIWGDIENSFNIAANAPIKNFQYSDGSIIEEYRRNSEIRAYQITATDDQGRTVIVTREVKDDASNADNFWFARDVTIMDAQKGDRLKFYGITLTGGDTTMTTAALAVSTLVSPLFGAGLAGAAAAVNLGRMAADLPLIYFDRFVPWINYKLVDGEAEGTKDLLVGYVLDDLLNLFGLLDGGAAPAPKGVMRVVDFDRGAGRIFSQPGDLGISLDDINPLALLSLIAPRLAGVPIAQSLITVMLASAMAASVDYTARRYTGFAKDNGWLAEGDPLVIDLDGDGIETISLGDSRAYFDVDGDLFREKTGWLKGDDGFLVLDANANGRIDDISEMFGNRFQGGYAELAAYDTNHDGKISVADLIWSELKVWQDKDRDGETDAVLIDAAGDAVAVLWQRDV
jgi:hypothetical protein